MPYYSWCDRKTELEREIESIEDEINEMRVEDEDGYAEDIESLEETLNELETEWEELNSAIGAYEDGHGIH